MGWGWGQMSWGWGEEGEESAGMGQGWRNCYGDEGDGDT